MLHTLSFQAAWKIGPFNASRRIATRIRFIHLHSAYHLKRIPQVDAAMRFASKTWIRFTKTAFLLKRISWQIAYRLLVSRQGVCQRECVCCAIENRSRKLRWTWTAPRGYMRPDCSLADRGNSGGRAMCGILGYVGNREAEPILIEGLRRLEYRGYDSAGIATLTGPHLQRSQTRRPHCRAGPVISRNGLRRAAIGISHTRWATHGAANDRNAHPHVSARRHASPSSTTASSKTTRPCKRQLQSEGDRFHQRDRHRGDRPA